MPPGVGTTEGSALQPGPSVSSVKAGGRMLERHNLTSGAAIAV